MRNRRIMEPMCRLVIGIALFAIGCYSPGKDGNCELRCSPAIECPGGLVCTAGLCGTSLGQCDGPADAVMVSDVPANGDSMIDGATFTGCVTSAFTGTASLIPNASGKSYSRAGTGIALYQDGTTQNIMQITAPGGTAAPLLFVTMPLDTISQPMVAVQTVGGKEQAFFLSTSADSIQLVKSLRETGATWATPTPVTVTGVLVDSTFRFGQPTATIPRRAMASHGLQMFEGIEQAADGSWSFSAITIPGTFTQSVEPSLSRDGLTAVFVGRDANTLIRLFVANRIALGTPFLTATALQDQPAGANGTEQFPTFDSGCNHIYLSTDNVLIDLP